MANLPPNVEVNHLHYATLAAFIHCGMIWFSHFSDDTVEPTMVYRHYMCWLQLLQTGVDSGR